MTPQELKASILQLAIQGKLVEQRDEEGTAEELYQQIQKEKQRLIKIKAIKKEKDLFDVAEDERPYDLPTTWKWVRIGQVFNLQAGKNVVASDIYESSTPEHSYLCYGGNGVRGFVTNYNNDGTYAIIGRQGALCGNINLAQGQFYATEHAVVVDHFSLTDVMWGAYFLEALNLNQYATATAQPGLAVANINKVLIPLPPLAEQKRIVAKIEELLPYIDRYEQAWSRLEDFNRRFPVDMQKSILQMAIQGKLVEQRPEEGTGEELYQQIQQEKQQLIKAGTIKKEKPLPTITEDEIPFDIPEGWKWVRLLDLCKSITDGDHQAPPQTNTGVPFLVISDVSSGDIDFSNTRHVPQEYFNTLAPERIPERGDMLFTVTGSYGIPVKVETDQRFCFQRHMALMKLMLDWDYVYYLMLSPIVKSQCDSVATGTAQKTVGLKSLRSLIVPLPPLAEQKRIVAKLEEILPLCERLK